jgi:hypothetical protein
MPNANKQLVLRFSLAQFKGVFSGTTDKVAVNKESHQKDDECVDL